MIFFFIVVSFYTDGHSVKKKIDFFSNFLLKFQLFKNRKN